MSTPFINLTTPQAVVAAVPVLMRFVPTNSVVAIMFAHTEHDQPTVPKVSMRFDITVTTAQAAAMPTTAHLSAADYSGALLITICDPEYDAHARNLLDAVRDSLHRVDIPVTARLMTHTLTAPDRWIDPDTGASGPTIPYTDSHATAAAVLAGDVITQSRDQLVAEFAATDAAPYLPIEGDFEDLVAQTVTELHAVITGNTLPTPQLATRAAIVVTAHTTLRDGLLRLGTGHHINAARTWTRIAAQLRGAARAEVLTVAAFHYYVGNDATRAGIAVDHAQDAAHDAGTRIPRLARLLEKALEHQVEPTQLREIIPTRRTAPIPGTDF